FVLGDGHACRKGQNPARQQVSFHGTPFHFEDSVPALAASMRGIVGGACYRIVTGAVFLVGLDGAVPQGTGNLDNPRHGADNLSCHFILLAGAAMSAKPILWCAIIAASLTTLALAVRPGGAAPAAAAGGAAGGPAVGGRAGGRGAAGAPANTGGAMRDMEAM